MQILVSGKQLDVGDALRTHVEERLQSGVAKYFSNSLDAHVVFSREGQGYRADCSVHVGQGIHAQARAEAADIYQAFDQASDRLEKRLRRNKRRLRSHHGKERPKSFRRLSWPNTPRIFTAAVLAKRSCSWIWRNTRC